MVKGMLRERRARALAFTLGTAAVVEVLAGVGLILGVGWSWRDALNAFSLTNSVMGIAFAVCGAILAWHRPSNPIGWLFVANGLGHATTALMAPLVQALHDGGASVGAQRLAATLYSWSWPWSIGLFLPAALLLFPDGRPPSPRWRTVVFAVIVTAPLFVLELGTSPDPFREGLPPAYLTLRSHDSLSALWALVDVRTSAALVAALVGLGLRYRKAGDDQRRQLLWLLLATIAAVAVVLAWSFVGGTPVAVLFAIPLIPVAVTVAILRHQLLDIRLVVSRALAWLLLSVAVVACYLVVTAVLDLFLSAAVGRSAVATVVIVVLVAPLLPRLQRLVDTAMYGDRRDPARVASRVGQLLLAGPDGGLAAVVGAVREALRLPYVALAEQGQVVATDGVRPGGSVCSVQLNYAAETVGELLVGLRQGERELSSADAEALALVAAPLAVAVRAIRLSTELQASRERIVAAREEERRRLRRDLHDGLGPTLTGIALAADASANLLDRDPAQARDLIASLRRDTRLAIADVRRLVDDLSPPALDELGLVGALRQRAEEMSLRPDGVAVRLVVDGPDDVPALPAAIEVAAYRIATEALTNVVRHSPAAHALVRLRCHDTLEVEISDDGPAGDGVWRAGVGLQAMAERAAELGGHCEAGPTPAGGRVYVTFPLLAR